jgi:hypothetical protein
MWILILGPPVFLTVWEIVIIKLVYQRYQLKATCHLEKGLALLSMCYDLNMIHPSKTHVAV